MLELGRVVLQHGSAAQQATLVHVATNSIHFHWQAPDGDSVAPPVLQQLRCSAPCAEVLTLAHLSACLHATGVSYRQQLRSDIVRLLSAALRRLRGVCCTVSLHCLRCSSPFPMPAPAAGAAAASLAEQQHRHLAGLMCGAFTASQANAAARAVGFIGPAAAADGRSMLQRLRLLCLDSIASLYSERKERSPAAAAPAAAAASAVAV